MRFENGLGSLDTKINLNSFQIIPGPFLIAELNDNRDVSIIKNGIPSHGIKLFEYSPFSKFVNFQEFKKVVQTSREDCIIYSGVV